MSQLIKQNSIPSGDFEEADEEELIPVKREPTRIEPEAGLPPSDDQLEFEECPQEGDDHPQREDESRANFGVKVEPQPSGTPKGKRHPKKTNKHHVTFDDQSDDHMTAQRKCTDRGPDSFKQKMESFDEGSLETEENQNNGCTNNENQEAANNSGNIDNPMSCGKDEDKPNYVGCYERSALQYDNQLFINKYRIHLTPPITTDILEQEFYLDQKEKYKTYDYSNMFRESYIKSLAPKKAPRKPQAPTYDAEITHKKLEIGEPVNETSERSEHRNEESGTEESFKYPDFPPWYPFSYYSFQRYLDVWEIEREIFDRQVDFIRRKPGRYISPLRLQKAALLSMSRPSTLRTTIRPPSPISTFRSHREPQSESFSGSSKLHKVHVEEPTSPPVNSYKLGDVERRLDRLNEKARSLDSHIQHLKYLWHP